MQIESNGFFEYLELQGGKADLCTKSELIHQVRDAGYRLSDRQLTFYVSEGLVPHSVRAGSRAGVYPAVVVQLMKWILQMREEGLSIDALRELLPVWKFLIKARSDSALALGEFEYVARQHVTSLEAMIAIPRVLWHVMVRARRGGRCENVVLIDKAGRKSPLSDHATTVGFAIARLLQDDDESAPVKPVWFLSTRITVAATDSPNTDPTTVILGRKPGESLPPDPGESGHQQKVDVDGEEVTR
ncbi:helix-turn-helix domain-containing protein [Mycobacterium colombiense]